MLEKETIEVNGKIYELQHPGVRAWLKIKGKMYSVQQDSLDIIQLLDYCFEHVVWPAEGGKLKLDDIPLKEVEEVWAIILPRFLRGDLESGYTYP